MAAPLPKKHGLLTSHLKFGDPPKVTLSGFISFSTNPKRGASRSIVDFGNKNGLGPTVRLDFSKDVRFDPQIANKVRRRPNIPSKPLTT